MFRFSIIIPEYKSGDKIQPAIESLQRQSFREFEVIIIDDCSPDDSFEKIDNLICTTELNSKLIKANTNGGPGVARNIGLSKADGQYICFMDADDYISDDYFESLNEIILNKKPDLIYFGYYHIFGNTKRVTASSYFSDKDSFIAKSTGAIWRFCIKKSLLSIYPLPSIRNAEDIAIIPLLIGSAKKIEYSDKPLYYYIHNNSSLSSIHKPDVTYNFIKSFDYTLSFLEPPYSSCIEFHGIKTILYGAILNGIKAKIPTIELREIVNGFELKFSRWSQNKFLQAYSLRKRLFLSLVKGRHFTILGMYVRVHSILLKYL
ncbi:glycosyltransferase family 2 protein [Parabacteroides sp. ZJ-118]|uniref:glycosyltransferase family 2 protein n=1 Tax=Parabacteroides sp. ZJ-118 TaxID=2709398 RepID=UPI0013EAE45B|nr:glycosyltransferase family 2 protein [Parabacteroides sp. ZJ-118]